MRRQFVIATVIVAIVVLAVLMVPPIMSEESDKKDTSCIYCDITGDSRSDVLMRVTTFDEDMMPTIEIRAVDGSNGEELWKSDKYPNCYADTHPVGDLNGDNKSDVLIVLGSCVDITSGKGYGEVIGVNGCDGTKLWSKSIEGARNEAVRMFANPANLTSANRTDVVLNTITYTLMSGPETKVMAINGSDGSELWGKSFTNSQVFGVPVDIDNDGIDEVVMGMPEEMAKSLAPEGFYPMTSNVTVVKGNNGTEFWRDSKDYSDVATFEPAGDLNGDGKNDLMVWQGCRNGGCKLGALRGTDGYELWEYDII
ncbi:MAG: hypothetical protein WBE22_03800 [Halobacteriota archaeon]